MHVLEEPATDANFDERLYLDANPDVASAVAEGRLSSGREHFDLFGRGEGRRIRISSRIREPRKRKMEAIRPLLRRDLPYVDDEGFFDFLPACPGVGSRPGVPPVASSNSYDAGIFSIIDRFGSGMILDCGAGRRPLYFDNVVNLDLVRYDTTDVAAAAEDLPFRDGSFDAVISNSVLEHVKNPFVCAGEIARVLKPGGELYCCVPFLQPLHDFPGHFYNMTAQGAANLFDGLLAVDRVEVIESGLPIWTLTWFLRSWASGLSGRARDEFLAMRVSDLIGGAASYMSRGFVANLPAEKNFELACGIVLSAHKPGP